MKQRNISAMSDPSQAQAAYATESISPPALPLAVATADGIVELPFVQPRTYLQPESHERELEPLEPPSALDIEQIQGLVGSLISAKSPFPFDMLCCSTNHVIQLLILDVESNSRFPENSYKLRRTSTLLSSHYSQYRSFGQKES